MAKKKGDKYLQFKILNVILPPIKNNKMLKYWADGEEHFEEMEIVCQKLENGPVGYDNPWK